MLKHKINKIKNIFISLKTALSLVITGLQGKGLSFPPKKLIVKIFI